MARPQAAVDLDFVRELSVPAADHEPEVYMDENYDAHDADLVIQSTGTETNPPLNFKVHRKVLAAASAELANLIQAHLEKLEQEENAAHAEPVMAQKAAGEEKAVKPKAVKAKAVKPVEAEKAENAGKIETAEKTEKGTEAEKAAKAKNTDREDTAEKSENAENAEKADQISQRKIAKLPGSRVGQAKTGKASSPVYIESESESDDSDEDDLEYEKSSDDESSDDDDTSDEDDSSDSDDSSDESSPSVNEAVPGTSHPVEKREKKQQKLGKLYNHENLNKENDRRIIGDAGNHAGAHAPKIFPRIVLPHSDDIIRVLLAAAYNKLEGMQLQLDDEWEFIQEVWETAARYQMFVLRCYAQMTLIAQANRIPAKGALEIYARASHFGDEYLCRHFIDKAANASASDMSQDLIRTMCPEYLCQLLVRRDTATYQAAKSAHDSLNQFIIDERTDLSTAHFKELRKIRDISGGHIKRYHAGRSD